jgi:hypothetical protein
MCDHKCKTINCKHANVIYCSKCEKTYCKDCGKEWGEKEYIPYYPYVSIPSVYPNPWPTPYVSTIPYTTTWASTDTKYTVSAY